MIPEQPKVKEYHFTLPVPPVGEPLLAGGEQPHHRDGR